ncbi:hypothetical protein BDY24DRAFT_385702 [Mrakia frigida]|uniref:uncharacterized protein n=1 Tax=Mrakia frigida TaxID=29902 RepID=UPI003FCBF7C7
MPASRTHRRTLHLLVPSPFPTAVPTTSTSTSTNLPDTSPLTIPSPSSPPPSSSSLPTKKPSRKVLALARELAAERGEILLDAPSGAAMKAGGVVGAQSELKSVKGAREWNGLLCWARKKRGPQWDAATQMWQVDFLSPEYYEPSLSVPAPPPVEVPAPAPPPTGTTTGTGRTMDPSVRLSRLVLAFLLFRLPLAHLVRFARLLLGRILLFPPGETVPCRRRRRDSRSVGRPCEFEFGEEFEEEGLSLLVLGFIGWWLTILQ